MITYINKTCPQCHSSFVVTAHRRKKIFCSLDCRRAAHAPKIELRHCENCGQAITAILSHVGQSPKRFCSVHCAVSGKYNPMYGVIRRGPDAPMWGKHHSEGAKAKLRTVALARPAPSAATRKKLATWTGRKHSPETRRKMSESRRAIWADSAFRQKIKTVYPSWTSVSPNGLEQAALAMMPPGIRYVGNGAYWKLLPDGNRKNPDFKVTGANKVIEVFGDYWHRGENPDDLIQKYRAVGLDCLVLWESEIKGNPVRASQAIHAFVGETP